MCFAVTLARRWFGCEEQCERERREMREKCMGAQKVGDAFYPVPHAWLILLGRHCGSGRELELGAEG